MPGQAQTHTHLAEFLRQQVYFERPERSLAHTAHRVCDKGYSSGKLMQCRHRKKRTMRAAPPNGRNAPVAGCHRFGRRLYGRAVAGPTTRSAFRAHGSVVSVVDSVMLREGHAPSLVHIHADILCPIRCPFMEALM